MRPAARLCCRLALPLLVLTGCAAGNFDGSLPSVNASVPVPPVTLAPGTTTTLPSNPITTSTPSRAYHAYGDSITYGATLSDPGSQAYPALAGQSAGLTVTNRGNPGDLACDVSGFAILPHADSPSAASPLHYSLLIGTNDADFYGLSGAALHEPDYVRCLQASLAWLAVPAEFKILAGSPTVGSTSAGTMDTQDGIVTRSYDNAGDTLSFPFQIGFASPIYLWYRVAYGNSGVFSWSVDGKAGGTVAAGESAVQISNHGFTTAMVLLRIPAVAAGSHVLVLTQTVSAPGGMAVVGMGVAPGAGQVGLSRVLAGTIPRQLQGGGSPCDQTDALCARYTADVTAAVTLFAGDGLNVHLFDCRAYMTGTAADMNDTVHPNQLGHREIAHAVEDVLN